MKAEMTGKEEKTVKLEVFDPPMCCSSGVCGPNVDKKLVQFSAALDWLRSQGVQVERYNPTHQYDAFASNATVVRAINDEGLNCLPIILLSGEIVSHSSYPSRDELAAIVGLSGSATTVLRG
jgi:arsenite methyltransferase